MKKSEMNEVLRELLIAPLSLREKALEAAQMALYKDSESKLVTASGAAKRLGVSRSCVYAWMKRGLLKPIDGLPGTRQRFSTADLDKLTAGHGHIQLG